MIRRNKLFEFDGDTLVTYKQKESNQISVQKSGLTKKEKYSDEQIAIFKSIPKSFVKQMGEKF